MSTFVSKVWGYENQIANVKGAGYCGKILHVMPGWRCSIHFHARKHETFYQLKGELFVELWDVPKDIHSRAVKEPDRIEPLLHELAPMLLLPGRTLELRPFLAHRFHAGRNMPAEFIEFSSYDDAGDSYRVVPSGPMPSTVVV